MSKIKIVTDSASDIPFKHEDLYDIQVVPFKITLGDETYTSRVELQNNEFYELLEETGELPRTEPLSPFDFGELYGDLFEQGYTDIIMDAAREAGAYGGTIIHAKGTAGEMANKFMGVTIADEKEIVYIVSKSSEKNTIMKAIMEKAGLNSKAKAICFSLPVSDTAGLRLLED